MLFTAVRLGDAKRSVQAALSWRQQLYAVDTKSGRERLVLPNFALEASWNKDQTKLVYSYDPSGDPAERQHRVQRMRVSCGFIIRQMTNIAAFLLLMALIGLIRIGVQMVNRFIIYLKLPAG